MPAVKPVTTGLGTYLRGCVGTRNGGVEGGRRGRAGQALGQAAEQVGRKQAAGRADGSQYPSSKTARAKM